LAKSIVTASEIRKKKGEYPCPKCPPGYRLQPMKKGKKRKSLGQCKCISVLRVLGAAGARKAKLALYKYGKTRKLKRWIQKEERYY